MAGWDRNKPWRQGHLVTIQASDALGIRHPDAPEDTAIVVISHDCDLAQSPTAEPDLEVIVGRFIPEPDGNFTHTKNPRILHLPYTGGEKKATVELYATNKQLIPKQGKDSLVEHPPRSDVLPTPAEQTILQRWLAARYRRAGFPDGFERRLKDDTKLKDDLVAALKRFGAHIDGIYFDVDNGQDVTRQSSDDTYSLTIYLVYSTQTDPDKADSDAEELKRSIEAAFKKRCCPDGKVWRFIELQDCMVLADEAMTYSQSNMLKRWHVDWISLRT